MVRGRATGRGTRRGAAASGRRAEGGGGDVVIIKEEPSSAATPSAFPAATTSTESAPPAAMAVRRAAATTTTRGTRGASSTGRFRPKVIRRDETERDALAQQEQQKADERAADERRARGRSRFRGKRSRGDAMGSRGGRPIAGASGPFAGGPGMTGGARSGGFFGGGGGGGGGFFGGAGGKTESKGSSGFGFAGAGGYREPRINADKLHAMTSQEDLDSDDEAMIAALQSKGGSATMPMGIYRKEHKETPVIVATTAELEAQENAANGLQQDDEEPQAEDEEESLWVEGSGPPVEQLEDEGAEGAAVAVKQESTDEDAMALDPDVKPEAAAGAASQNTGTTSTGSGRKSASTTATTTTKTKKKKAAAQDPEESMIRTDLSLLASELGAVALTEDDGASKGEAPAGGSDKDGRLYLFQFPPLLPPLRPVAAPRAALKSEAQPISLHSTPAAGTPVDLKQDRAQEIEDDDEDDEEDEDGRAGRGFGAQALAGGGMIGRLNVRRSGKVELDWGGHVLEMSPAAGMNFLTTAVIVEESDDKPQNGVTGGESIGMGKIMGRFVLAPIWSEEEEWDVPPEELVIEG